jgi:hypothetical protein
MAASTRWFHDHFGRDYELASASATLMPTVGTGAPPGGPLS